MACMSMTYTILSTKGRETVQGDAVAAILRGVDHGTRLLPMGGVTVESGEGETIAEVTLGAMIDRPGGIVVELADGTEVDLSETESDREAGALLRAAMGQ